MLNVKAICVLAATVVLAGCDVTASDGGMGLGTGTLSRAYSSTKSAVGLSSGDDAVSAVSNAAMGGLIGAKLGPSLTEDDRKIAYEAELLALDKGAPGAPVPWKNPATGHYGNIVVGPAYDQKGAQCRGFSHTITIKGDLKSARGTACRSSDGAWAAVG
jgi:surface antigen